ncbi:hypothetical protein M670_00481 [Schinkia azotoformans MEV2011]|uniref:Uncharacterized protein n=1 Tax=Schinkia azotoformans MEV2011 TaxID=1348973 RepID=A0A072P4P3_SCHAZ|nr:hypothetical protein [Schinkia azotoformans]KEF40455.1 hypothetical protein M670_00481 [Schinkia azotoformans MEV2011]MEC1696135.1 hypothetical protein [Schinkia azotoformans]MEC1716650.1 hypothetical protein [Schinkia azotoformans]MEC1725362.1 hypothetical protein [Schinkia azotoformans]MEC1739489.1 hypothetical protein [Schinkia azotoformans]
MGLQHFVLTEEKVRKLKPIFESILSRKYGREIRFIELTWGDITIHSDKEAKDDKSA